MKRGPSTLKNPLPAGTLVRVLVLAAAGQYFMAQADESYTLWVGLVLFGTALWLARPIFSAPVPAPPQTTLGRRTEALCFLAILALAAFLRLYRLDSMPSGLHTDQGLMGMFADRIAFEGWRPFFEVFNYHIPEVTMFYLLAGWFRLFGSSWASFSLFFVSLSLAAFPLIYGCIRLFSGPRVALLSLFFLAVMRWHILFSRNGFPTIEVPFYLFAALAFWLYWRTRRGNGALVLCAVTCGLGLYAYQAFKAVPLLFLTYALYERSARGRNGSLGVRPILAFFLLIGLISAPLLVYMFQKGNLGLREQELFIGKEILEKRTLAPTLDRWVHTALMFNRLGDPSFHHNIPNHRMLDDGTAVFFILGTGWAFYRRKERGPFYALAGLGVMSLPCLLSIEAAHSNRMLGVTPFVAYLAALGLDPFLEVIGRPGWKGWGGRLALGLFLAFVACRNAYDYFHILAGNHPTWRAYGVEQTYIGKKIESLEGSQKGRWDYDLTPAYFGNPTVAFLGYPADGRLVPLDLQRVCYAPSPPSGRNRAFILEEGKVGELDLLETLFPGGTEERLRDWDGHTLVYWYQVPREPLPSSKPWDRGLKGTYIPSLSWKDKPLAVRWDPVLNFGSSADFPFRMVPPFSIRWEGSLEVPVDGSYRLQALTNGRAAVWLDGRKVFDTGTGRVENLRLRKGLHALRLEDQQEAEGKYQSFDLVWIHPGAPDWEVVPARFYGRIGRGKGP